MPQLNLTHDQVQEVAFLATDGLFEENGQSCILCGQPHVDSPGGFCLCTQVPLLVADWLAMHAEREAPPAGEHAHDADRYHSAGSMTLDGVVAHSEGLLREAPPAGEVCDLAREVLALDAEATPGPWHSKDRRLPVGYEVVVLGHNSLICDIALPPGLGPTPNADFIARARTAAPALARAVLAQAAELAAKDAEIARLGANAESYADSDDGFERCEGTYLYKCPECRRFQDDDRGHTDDCSRRGP